MKLDFIQLQVSKDNTSLIHMEPQSSMFCLDCMKNKLFWYSKLLKGYIIIVIFDTQG